MLDRSPKAVNVGPRPDAVPKPDVEPKPDAGPKPDAVNAGPKPNAVNGGLKPNAGPKPNAVNAGPKPDAGPKPNAVNAGPKPDVGPKPKSSKCMLDRKVQEMRKQRSMLRSSAGRCKVVILICLRSLWREGGNSVLKSQELDERRLLSQL
ncbi:hypothetical protein CRG98_030614 [Punica granatum]|uniref:Uncharacterized protein n=1 Tax=Punica granatum TaxID=22663 RepID=A0A2I0IYD7_PUNGR|nr:hypothetical protein CRG98_030614 [Punica granatum]